MGLFVQQEHTRTKLQERIAADLRAKAAASAKQTSANMPDGVDDSAYIEGTKQTTSLAWVWLVIFIVVVGLLLYFLFQPNGG